MTQIRSLRVQLAAATFLAVASTVAISLTAAMGVMGYEEARVDARLSPQGRVARAELAANKRPTDTSALEEVLDVQRQVYGERGVIDRSVFAVIGLSTIGVGVIFALVFANRLSQPLETVSRAAKAVAAGNFAARAEVFPRAAGEAADLITDFNRMAQTLQSYDRQSTETLAAIAHELRTPLAILRGRLQGFQDGLYPFDGSHVMGMIRQVDGLSRIVSDLSLVSLAAAGRLSIDPTELDLARQMTALIDDLRPDLERQGLAVETDLRPALAWVDPNRLSQAVLALIDNVVVHARSGGNLRIETRSEVSHVILAVLDRGDGLPDAALERIFDPFWRSGLSLASRQDGHGLGLSVVSSIVRAHQGDVSVQARVGGGAEFRLILPRRGHAV